MSFLKKILQSVFQATIPSYVFENNQLKFNLYNEKTVVYDLNAYDIKTRHDPYAFDAYTIKNGDIHLEYLRRDHNTQWNGFARGFYESLMKEQLKLKSLEPIKREEFKTFELSTYKVNDNFVLHMIYIWETHKDIFIIDTKGELFTSLMKAFNPEYTYAYSNESHGAVNFDISLVKNNAFQSYFNQSN